MEKRLERQREEDSFQVSPLSFPPPIPSLSLSFSVKLSLLCYVRAYVLFLAQESAEYDRERRQQRQPDPCPQNPLRRPEFALVPFLILFLFSFPFLSLNLFLSLLI